MSDAEKMQALLAHAETEVARGDRALDDARQINVNDEARSREVLLAQAYFLSAIARSLLLVMRYIVDDEEKEEKNRG